MNIALALLAAASLSLHARAAAVSRGAAPVRSAPALAAPLQARGVAIAAPAVLASSSDKPGAEPVSAPGGSEEGPRWVSEDGENGAPAPARGLRQWFARRLGAWGLRDLSQGGRQSQVYDNGRGAADAGDGADELLPEEAARPRQGPSSKREPR